MHSTRGFCSQFLQSREYYRHHEHRMTFRRDGPSADSKFGDESWRDLYQMDPQLTLFGDIRYQRDPGVSSSVSTKETSTTLFQKVSEDIENFEKLHEYSAVRVHVLRWKPPGNRSCHQDRDILEHL